MVQVKLKRYYFFYNWQHCTTQPLETNQPIADYLRRGKINLNRLRSNLKSLKFELKNWFWNWKFENIISKTHITGTKKYNFCESYFSLKLTLCRLTWKRPPLSNKKPAVKQLDFWHVVLKVWVKRWHLKWHGLELLPV